MLVIPSHGCTIKYLTSNKFCHANYFLQGSFISDFLKGGGGHHYIFLFRIEKPIDKRHTNGNTKTKTRKIVILINIPTSDGLYELELAQLNLTLSFNYNTSFMSNQSTSTSLYICLYTLYLPNL